jgi:O-antigen/teichoic acid export membrane protein
MGGSTDAFSDKVAINMVTNLVRTALVAVIGLVMVPFYIDNLGVSAYGIIPLATSVTTYVLAASDSLSNVISRYMIVSIQTGNWDEAKKVYSTSSLSVLAIAGCLLPVMCLLSYAAPSIFHTGTESATDVQLMFLMIMLTFLLFSISSIFDNIFKAFNKLYITYISKIVQIVMQMLLIVFLFYYDKPSLIHVGSGYLLSALVLFFSLWFFSRKLCPQLHIERRHYNHGFMKEVMGLGGWSMISEFGALMFIQSSLILVNMFLGATQGGTFAIVVNMISMIGTACFSVTANMIPVVYYHYSRNDSESMCHVLKLFTKFIGLFMAFPLAFLCIFIQPILEVWVGKDFIPLGTIISLMVIVEVGVCSSRILESVPIIFKRIRPVAIFTMFMGVMNIILSSIVLEYTDWGMYGVAAVWISTTAVLLLLFLPLYSSKLIGVKRLEYLKQMAKCYAVFFGLIVLGEFIKRNYTLPATWTAILTVFFTGFMIYLILILRFGTNKKDKGLLISFLPGFIQKYAKKI